LIGLLIVVPLGIGPFVLIMQALSWLHSGRWPAVPVSRALDYWGWAHPSSTWRGIQKIYDWLLAAPFSVVSFVGWILVVIVASTVFLFLASLVRPSHNRSNPASLRAKENVELLIFLHKLGFRKRILMTGVSPDQIRSASISNR
jgi:hypothetical protein